MTVTGLFNTCFWWQVCPQKKVCHRSWPRSKHCFILDIKFGAHSSMKSIILEQSQKQSWSCPLCRSCEPVSFDIRQVVMSHLIPLGVRSATLVFIIISHACEDVMFTTPLQRGDKGLRRTTLGLRFHQFWTQNKSWKTSLGSTMHGNGALFEPPVGGAGSNNVTPGNFSNVIIQIMMEISPIVGNHRTWIHRTPTMPM